MSGLTTHVLDALQGGGAIGVRVDLQRVEGGATRHLKTVTTGEGGRVGLLDGGEVAEGEYELVFHVADYFRARGVALPDPPFLDDVPVRFAVTDVAAHYHVPLVASPWTYSTYRGGSPPKPV
jgi:5-hydroxyisourate hydrolase